MPYSIKKHERCEIRCLQFSHFTLEWAKKALLSVLKRCRHLRTYMRSSNFFLCCRPKCVSCIEFFPIMLRRVIVILIIQNFQRNSCWYWKRWKNAKGCLSNVIRIQETIITYLTLCQDCQKKQKTLGVKIVVNSSSYQ